MAPILARRHAAPLAELLSRTRIPGLDFLRALAVLLVLINHSDNVYLGPILLANGGLGVEIFFVLSGFLITSMLMIELETRQKIRLGAFFQRRAARLLPIFYIYLLFGMVYLQLRGKPIPWGAVSTSAVYVLNYYQAFTGAPTHFLSHCWSLAVEEQFYVLWPLALFFIFKRRWPLPQTIAAIMAGVWVYRSTLLFSGIGTDEYLYRALDTRADHLLAGCLLAVLLKNRKWQSRFEMLYAKAWVLPLLWTTLVISGSLQSSMAYKYAIGYVMEPILIAATIPLVILAAGRPKANWGARILNARVAVITGQASYGVYLFHQLVMHPLRTVAEQLTHHHALAIGLSIASVVFLAHLSFTWVENPLRQRLRPAPEGGKGH